MKSLDIIISVLMVGVAAIFPLLFSYAIGGWVKAKMSTFRFANIPDMTGKTVMVTGINTGIGKVTAVQLALKGATVIGTVRSLEKGDFTNEVNRYAKGKIIPMVLELSSLGSVQNFVDTFKKNYPELPIDVMILNAAVMITPPELTADGVELQFGVNHLGHFLLVQLLWDDILKSKTRLVHVSSIAHKFSYPEGIRFSQLQSISEYNSVYAYGQSKLANILFSNELAARTNGTGVTSNSLHPGSIASDLQRHIPGTYAFYSF
jgi:WW domain-containing oxidoreductase